MKRILITGMSGTGKSTLISELSARGYNAVDLDAPAWSEWAEVDSVAAPESPDSTVEPGRDWVWREDRVRDLLSKEDSNVLFISGCAENMAKFYPQFDDIILLSAPPNLIVERLASRTTNSYGKRPDQVTRVLGLIQTIEPRLRKIATHEIDTSLPLGQTMANVLSSIGMHS
jgi:dephospho-CoA kinase